MSKLTRILPLTVAICSATTFAGGFDHSKQSFNGILGSDNLISFKVTSTSATIDGSANSKLAETVGNINSSNIDQENTLDLGSAEVGGGFSMTDSIRCAFKIDTPYQTDTEIKDDALNYFDPTRPMTPVNQIAFNSSSDSEDTPIATTVNSTAFTVGCGYGIQMGKSRLTIYAGPKIEKLSGFFSADKINDAAGATVTGAADNISYDMSSDFDPGFVAGIGYEIEEYAMKINLAYHSSIEHKMDGTVTAGDFMKVALGGIAKDNVKTKVNTPAAVNLNVQTGVMPGWLVFGGLRWAQWSELKSLNVKSDSDIFDVDLGLFSNDTLDYSFGVGHQLTKSVAVLANYSSSIKLGDSEEDGGSLRQAVGDTHTMGLGARAKVNENIAVSGGLGYTYIKEYTIDNGSYTLEQDASHATSITMGLDIIL